MRRWIAALCALLVWASPRALGAQRLITLGLGGGVSFPQGDLADAANTGWNALGTLILSTPMQPLGLRADVAYNSFGFSAAEENAAGTSGSHSVASVTANVTYRLPTPGTPVSPHLIAGLGAYRTDCSLDVCEAATHFGWNAGLGMKFYLLGLRSFVEARYHHASADGGSISYVPVTLGLIF